MLPEIAKLKRLVKGKIVLPSHPQYQKSCVLFNRAVHRTPAMFVKVRQPGDIRHALNYARKHKLPISVRGGGHSAVGSGLVTDGMVIDMRELNKVTVYPEAKKIRVSAGALNHEVDEATHKHHLALPQGTCRMVGTIGSTLGGGIGFLSRKLGLMSDNVERFTMLNAAGEFMQIDQEQHADLFWALRGAGANQFGVITQIDYRAHSMPEMIYGGTISWPISVGKEIFQRYRDLLADAPDDLFLYAYIPHAPKDRAVVSLFGFYLADSKKSQQIFDEIQQWSPPCDTNLAYRTYMDLQSAHYEEELAVDWKHGFIPGLLTDELIELFIDIFHRCPENCGGIMLDPLGGAINRVDKSATAFIHRDSQFICSITGLYSGSFMPKPIKDWVRDSYQALSPHFNGFAYQNYEDLEIDEAQCYFGEHVGRLKQLKSKYDPDNVFGGSLTR